MRIEELKKRLCIPEELFDEELSRHGWSWHQLARGELPLSFEELQLAIICRDPVLWSAAFLKDPDTGEPYRYWDYQLESVRDMGNVIHADGAEVGKTREIGNLILWGAFTQGGSSTLVGAPEQVHLDDIIDYCLEQMFHLSPELGKALARHKKHPHHVFYFANRSKIYFSPAGFDGTGFRGKHVDKFAIMEEAAKVKNPDIWNEFFRAAKPGCSIRIYSVPDGDRSTVYYRLKEAARRQKKDDNLGELTGSRHFTFYNWRKTMQPEPFWSEERRKFYIELYGGEDSPGYKRNVLGEDGDPESAVFPWQVLTKSLKDIEEYRCLKIIADGTSVHIKGTRYDCQYEDSRPTGKEVVLIDRTLSAGSFNLEDTMKGFFRAIGGLIYVGGDFGYSRDPSELVVRLVVGKVWRTIARVHLRGVNYDMQADCVSYLDDIFSPAGFGFDYGNAGSAVVHILQNNERFRGRGYIDRVVGYQFAESFEDVDEEGNVVLDPRTDKPRKKSAKQLATDLMLKKMQRAEYELPLDPDYITQFSTHTAREGSKGMIYSKGNDHTIDAERACTLRQVLNEVVEDLFAVGA